MPVLTSAAKAIALDALGGTITQLSLHSGYSSIGDLELVGGAPPYARLPVIWANAASSAIAAVRQTTGYIFDVPPATTVAWLGLWGDDGTFYGMLPVGNSRPFEFVLSDDLTTIICPLHLFAEGSEVVPWIGINGGNLPLTEDFLHMSEGVGMFTVNVTDSTFQVSADVGLAPLTFAFPGSGYIQGITPVVFANQGTFPVATIFISAQGGA